MTFNSDAQTSLPWFVARLQRTADLRQHPVRQLQQNFPWWRKAQRLAFTHEQAGSQGVVPDRLNSMRQERIGSGAAPPPRQPAIHHSAMPGVLSDVYLSII